MIIYPVLCTDPKLLRLLTETLLSVNGAVSVLAMFSDGVNVIAGTGLAGAGLESAGLAGAGTPDAELLDAAELATLVFASAETHCNAKANTIVSSTNVFLARFSIFFQLKMQNTTCAV